MSDDNIVNVDWKKKVQEDLDDSNWNEKFFEDSASHLWALLHNRHIGDPVEKLRQALEKFYRAGRHAQAEGLED